jgi:hypothetical protein
MYGLVHGKSALINVEIPMHRDLVQPVMAPTIAIKVSVLPSITMPFVTRQLIESSEDTAIFSRIKDTLYRSESLTELDIAERYTSLYPYDLYLYYSNIRHYHYNKKSPISNYVVNKLLANSPKLATLKVDNVIVYNSHYLASSSDSLELLDLGLTHPFTLQLNNSERWIVELAYASPKLRKIILRGNDEQVTTNVLELLRACPSHQIEVIHIKPTN